MTSSVRSLILTAIVALIAGLSGVWLGSALMRPSSPSLHDLVHRELHLSRDQETHIDALERAFTERRRALELEMQAANVELATAIREEHGYGPRVTAAVEHFHHAMGQLQEETLHHVFAMRETLSPAQKVQFDNAVSTALTTEPQ